MSGRLSIRDWVIAVMLFFMVSGVIVVPVLVDQRVEAVQVDLTCDILRANNAELRALKTIGKELGLPIPFVITPLPEECR